MSNVNPFKQPGQWYRGNTHSHSTESDGRLPIADRFAAYREAGYDFLVLTDHRKVNDTSNYSEDGFLAISGSEVHPNNPYGGDTYHIVAINIHERINCAELHPNAVIAEIKRQGGEAVLCHPYWCGHTLLDYLPLRDYFALEVYNDTCMGIGKGFSESAWDDLLDRGGPVFGIAADDAHGTEHDCFHGWVMVKAPELTTDAIMDAFRTGAFYSTLGPEITDLTLVEDADQKKRVTVQCSPAQSIVFKGQRSRGRRIVAPEGELLTEAEYEVPSGTKYTRVEITDEAGKKAWSNPFFF
ncbi:MAG: CehA/McbA family metallohydrolase [Candidatus Poribacteria bacterium]|nr:CehA/McbA family metallohydrolase [Candidatus Poribacteria bacterium]